MTSILRESDEALVDRIAAGDAAAMRTLFTRHHDRVCRLAQRIGKDATLAEDLVSEVFLEVWRNAGRFEKRSSVATWLLAITKYKTLSKIRRRREEESLDMDAAAELVDPSRTPEAALARQQGAAAIRACVNALTPEHRTIIDLIYYKGRTVKDVARLTGIPESTAKTRMFYARKRLSQLLRRSGFDQTLVWAS
jgi:RNA polymerase sigma-70 factor (ECF subfamily)